MGRPFDCIFTELDETSAKRYWMDWDGHWSTIMTEVCSITHHSTRKYYLCRPIWDESWVNAAANIERWGEALLVRRGCCLSNTSPKPNRRQLDLGHDVSWYPSSCRSCQRVGIGPRCSWCDMSNDVFHYPYWESIKRRGARYLCFSTYSRVHLPTSIGLVTSLPMRRRAEDLLRQSVSNKNFTTEMVLSSTLPQQIQVWLLSRSDLSFSLFPSLPF